jgi:ABC-type multidrug transport system ATPase subunit
MDTVRQSMGICPQHDVLFSDLTVAEHLKLFDQIKGVTVTAQSIQKRAEKFGLEDKVNALSCHLSGGMKRKLSIAIAFCGDSKFILLDEPTTGMDPYARRSTWEMLRKSKKDRVILLTTHFMDEAEILSDHIAVMKSGQLQCFGSPLFLKKAFGLGYTLTVVLSDSRYISGPDSDNGKGNSASQLKEDISSDCDLKIEYASETVDGETNQPQSEKTQENVEKVASGSSNVVSKNGTILDSADGRRLSIKLRRERPHLDQCFPSQIISFDEDRSAAQLKESTLFCGSNSRGTHVSDVNNEGMPQPPTGKAKHNIEVNYGGIFKPGASSGMDMVLMDEIDLSAVLELENGLGPQLFSNPLNSHDGKISGPLVTEFISTLSSDSTVKERFKHNIDVSCGDQHDNIVEDFINSRHSPNEFELENELGLQLQQFSPKLDSKALQCNKAMCDYNKNNHALGLPMQAHMNRIDSEANAGQEILRFLQHFVPETQLLRYSGREVMFRLPNGNENNFPALFEAFDDARMREKIRIGGYGITNSSLEEVFLLLAEDFAEIGLGINELQANLENPFFSTTRAASQYRDEDRSQHSCVSDSITSLSEVKCEWESVRVGFLGQMAILLRKRFTIQRRDIKGFLSIILVPFLAISLMLLILTVNLGPTGPPIQMSLDLYKNLPFGAENKAFSVLLGNGSSLQKNDTSILDLKDFLSLNSHFVDAYEAQDIGSSTVMSSYLLKTQGNNTKAARLCSYVVGDRINILVNMNWDQFWKLMQEANLMNYVNYTLLSSLLTSQPKRKSLSQRNLEAPDQNLESLAIGSLDAFDITHNGIVAKEILLNLQENGIDVSQLTNTLPPTGKPVTFHEVVNMMKKWPTGKAKYDIGVNTSVTILHNTTSPHAVAVFNHEYANSRYKQCTGNGTINIVNHPLPISTKKSIENRSILSIFAVLSTLIPLCFVPSALIVFVVKEKGCKSKHVQLVSGVRLSSFWIANYIWDMMMYSVLVALVMATLAFYGPNSAQVFMGDTASVFATAFLFFGYGVSALPFAYLICRTHESSSDAQISVLCWFFITGFMTLTTYGILLTTESTAYAATALKPFFQLFPAFNVGDGLLNLCLSFYERQISGKDSLPFNWNVAGGPIFLLFILSLPYFCLLLMLECSETGGTGSVFGHMLRKSRNFMNDAILKCSGISLNSDGELILDDSGGIEDDDVAFERNRVIQNEAALKSSAKILMVDLWKIYPAWGSVILKLFKNLLWSKCVSRNNSSNNRECRISDLSKQAVRGLTLAIEKGETFGLLGANGAGKSTTMAILTGDTTASLGEAVSIIWLSVFFLTVSSADVLIV